MNFVKAYIVPQYIGNKKIIIFLTYFGLLKLISAICGQKWPKLTYFS